MQRNTERDILAEITERRRAVIQQLGISFGCAVPEKRKRPIIPFLQKPGTILEIKRASPSKGLIAPNLNAAETAAEYIRAGTPAISILTEQDYFHGSLDDLKAVAEVSAPAAGAPVTEKTPALLRKDFLLSAEEIDISYLCGADAVLLIARILDSSTLSEMAKRAFELGISVLLEIREDSDTEKALGIIKLARKMNADGRIVLGINSRDLASFAIDKLSPLRIRQRLFRAYESIEPEDKAPFPRVISESGITSAEAAAEAGRNGFSGVLIGEAVARNTGRAAEFVEAFCQAAQTAKKSAAHNETGASFSSKAAAVLETQKRRPLVKICGITNAEDAKMAAAFGADMLGFVFSADSPRAVDADTVRSIRSAVSRENNRPLFAGVITDTASEEGKNAVKLAGEGVLDCIQYHSCNANIENGYPAVRIGSAGDVQTVKDLYKTGFPRILADAYVPGIQGGTGHTVPEDFVKELSELGPLWLAGGITPENAENIISAYRPELIDVSSGVEKSPGVKDQNKLAALFAAVNKNTEEYI